jgi:peptidoglycan DL-endopeptidase CwlO
MGAKAARMRVALLGIAAFAAAVTVAGDARASSPTLDAKRAEAQTVLKRVNALGVQFGRVVDGWDGARIQLAATEKQLAANERALKRARKQSAIAQARLARVLVAVYEHGAPTLPAIIVGASSISDLVDEIEAAQTVDTYDKRVAAAAHAWATRLTTARVSLKKTERTRKRTVSQLTHERRQIGTMLAQRKRMLASVQGEVKVLEAQQAARQHALEVAAQARLAREQAAREAAREAAAKAAAKRAAAAPPPPTTTVAPPPPSTSTTAPISTTLPGTTTALAPTTTTAAPAPTLPAGYPEAASIALKYLGIPYKWGGASPATGFDCSGLVMYVYAQLGVQLPHQSEAQYGYGVAVPKSQLQPGDLVFYDGLSHVAIYIGNGEIVHAPQTGDVVKIAPLSQGGLTYVGARRL